MRDHYRVLGINPKDDLGTIRAAYRRLVRQLHPDMNDDPVDHARFIEVTEAYRVLSDPHLRPKYDALRLLRLALPINSVVDLLADPARRQQMALKVTGGLQRMFDRAMHKVAMDGSDIQISRHVSFAESFSGVQARVSYQRPQNCPSCAGSAYADHRICPRCDGQGRIPLGLVAGLKKHCPTCGGTGISGHRRCPGCHGAGQVRAASELTVQIPAGVTNGTKLRIKGKGGQGRHGGRDGNLIVELQVDGSLYFNRRGLQLLMEMPIPLTMAVSGGMMNLELPDGSTRQISIPPFSYPGRTIQGEGLGFPVPSGKQRGDLSIKLDVEMPITLTLDERALIDEWFRATAESRGRPPEALYQQVTQIMERLK